MVLTEDTSATSALNAACFSLTVPIKGLHGLNVHSMEDVVLSGPVEPRTASHLHSDCCQCAGSSPGSGEAHSIQFSDNPNIWVQAARDLPMVTSHFCFHVKILPVVSWSFSQQTIWRGRGSSGVNHSGVNNKMNKGWISFSCFSFTVLLLLILAHCHSLLRDLHKTEPLLMLVVTFFYYDKSKCPLCKKAYGS